MFEGEFEEEDYACEADEHDGEVEQEDPSPSIALSKDTVNERSWDEVSSFFRDQVKESTRNSFNSPHNASPREILPSMTQRNTIRDDSLRQSHDSSNPTSLNTSSSKHAGEVLRSPAHDRSDCEEYESEEKDESATKNIRKVMKCGLEDCGYEQEGGADPEAFGCCAMKGG